MIISNTPKVHLQDVLPTGKEGKLEQESLKDIMEMVDSQNGSVLKTPKQKVVSHEEQYESVELGYMGKNTRSHNNW